MTITLPPPIGAYFRAEESNDFDAVARCFLSGGVVRDEGRLIEGRPAIAAWMAEAKTKYHHRTEVLSAHEADGDWLVSVRVSGSFPNSPITLEQAFRLTDGAIAALDIR